MTVVPVSRGSEGVTDRLVSTAANTGNALQDAWQSIAASGAASCVPTGSGQWSALVMTGSLDLLVEAGAAAMPSGMIASATIVISLSKAVSITAL